MDAIEFDRNVLETETEHEDDDRGSDDEIEPTATPIGSLTSTTTGYETVTVEVKDWNQSDHDKIEYTGTVSDKSDTIDVIAFEAIDAPSEPTGSTYRITDAKVDQHDGQLQLVLKPATEFESIQPGVGHTERPDAGQNEQLATTDGGTTADAQTDAGASDAKDIDDADQDDADGSDQSAPSQSTSGDTDSDADAVPNPSNEDIDARIIQEATKRQTGDGADRDEVAAAVGDHFEISADRVSNRIDHLLSNDRGIYRTTADCLKPK
jgi:hypothetical protein